MKKWFKSQRGSMAVYATGLTLTFIIILVAIFSLTTAIRKNQLGTELKIKEAYEQEIEVEEPTQKEYEFSYTGAEQTFVAPANGSYKLQVWGAQGGSYNSSYGVGGNGRIF